MHVAMYYPLAIDIKLLGSKKSVVTGERFKAKHQNLVMIVSN